jgi:hypothetical protein
LPGPGDLIARPSTRVASGLTTSACQRQQWALGCNWDIVLPGAKRTWTDNEALGAGGDEEQEHHRDGGARAIGRAGLVRLRAVLTSGLGRHEIEEILLQTAIYGGVFSTNTAFKTAQQVFREMDTTP